MRISRTIITALTVLRRHTFNAGFLAAALIVPVTVRADAGDMISSWWTGPAGFVAEYATTNDSYSRCRLILASKAPFAVLTIGLTNTGSLAITLEDGKPMLPGPMSLEFRGARGFNLEKTLRTTDGDGVFFAFRDAHVAAFITSFATASSMTVAVPGRPEFAFDLTGSRTAYGALTNCTAKVAAEDASGTIRR